MKITDGIFSRKSDEWETPQDLFDRLNEEFDFTLDACADESNAKCMLYFDKAQDGLKRDWGGTECGAIHHTAMLRNGYASAITKAISQTPQWWHLSSAEQTQNGGRTMCSTERKSGSLRAGSGSMTVRAMHRFHQQ